MASELVGAAGSRSDEPFLRVWSLRGEWVEEPNRRRGGESGVQRVVLGDGRQWYVKRQVEHLYRSLRHPFGRPTVLREREALLAVERLGVRVPRVVFGGVHRCPLQGWQGLLVTEALEGFIEFERWYAAQVGEGAKHLVLQQLAATLARLHRGGWQHGCLYAKHVFVRPAGEGGLPEVALLDLEKARRRLSSKRAALRDLWQFKRHSSLSEADWQVLIYGYEAAFGSAIKGLRS
ncbi:MULTISPECIES: lipopolysaccharide kinase InaA family protein [unclassified Pseudomonas]|jgi:tRNA A-37 threonylcarbamoyl transferase component Bud32|uniref:lipopolysaccharide kinase InaA family protein n=1 Tax=unclassified Pseudomonas TaxID=196821 RepID=UPI000EA8DDFE|nr:MULTISPECIES: lipopolysaccharide kinase InaA family protein [unclassified Pseudomonas]AYF90270.1 InaA protein [Pseudomonas sp. DY-1]MDH4652514.1 InaA protein [Pseudomonas sp. BN606]MRK20845.1 InaA protein [Pseudomonas sp. JG-B]